MIKIELADNTAHLIGDVLEDLLYKLTDHEADAHYWAEEDVTALIHSLRNERVVIVGIRGR